MSAVFSIIPIFIPSRNIKKRFETLDAYADQEELRVIREEDYAMEEFLRQVVFREEERCSSCYELRLGLTAKIARQGRFDTFTTTLLYSRFQKHDLIRSIGEKVARDVWGYLSSIGISARDGPKGSGNRRKSVCIGNLTVVASTVKKSAIATPVKGEGSGRFSE